MNRLRADLILLLAAIIWGTAFIAQKHGNQTMPPVLFVGLRFLLSALLLAPFALREKKKQGTPVPRMAILLACFIGFCLFTGSSLQQIGLMTTSATHGGFLTALYVVFVPLMMWLLLRKRPRPAVVAACCVSIAGAWLLAGQGNFGAWEHGDVVLVLADIGWSLAIMLVPVFFARAQRPFFLAFVQYAVTAALGLGVSLLFETSTWEGIRQAMPSLLYAGAVSGGFAFTLQIIAQKYTPTAEAALIMSLESVFAALAGVWMLGERLSLAALGGCALILLGVVMVEIGPLLRRKRAA